jgi:hypothetical protein
MLSRVEESGTIPGATFVDEIVPDQLAARKGWMARALAQFAGANLIFFDPDNGIEVKSTKKGHKKSSKFVYWDEIAEAHGAGHSLLIYQHFGRVKRDIFCAGLAQRLREVTKASGIWTIHTPHVLFLLATSDAKIMRVAACLRAEFGMRIERR